MPPALLVPLIPLGLAETMTKSIVTESVITCRYCGAVRLEQCAMLLVSDSNSCARLSNATFETGSEHMQLACPLK